MNNKKIQEEIEKMFAEEDYTDEKFPKGDKRRGEVIALIAILNAKIQKAISLAFKENEKQHGEELIKVAIREQNKWKGKLIQKDAEIKKAIDELEEKALSNYLRDKLDDHISFEPEDWDKLKQKLGVK